jgi:hypothetical protein
MRYVSFWNSLLILITFTLIPLAQAEVVEGTLFEKGTRKPLSGVNVFILPHKIKVVTGADGSFKADNVPPGKFTFIVNFSGYIRLEEKQKTGSKEYDLYIEKEFYDVFETVVTGVGEKKDVTKKSLSLKQFLKAPGAQEDPVKAVQNLPGVANQAFSSQIVIQGSEPDDTRYTLNGHEIPLVFHFGGLTSIVTPTAVGSVDYLSSGYGPEYGRALGGVINLNTRAPKTDRWHGEGFLDITKLGVLSEGPINDKSSLLMSGRVSYFGKILEAAAEEMDDFDVTAAPEFQDFYFNYNYKLSSTENFNFLGIKSKDTLSIILKESNNPAVEGNISQETNFYRFIGTYDKELANQAKLSVSLGYGEDDIFFTLSERYFDLDTSTFSQRAEYSREINSKWKTFIGLDSQYREAQVGIKLPTFNNQGGVGSTGAGETIADISTSSWESALYWRNLYELNDKLTLSPNLRVEYLSNTEETFLMPRFSLTYALNPSLDLTFASGLYYQAPQNGEASEEFGNPDVTSEKSTHYYAGFIKDFREGSNQGGLIEAGVFYKTLDDLIIQTDETRSDGSPLRNSNDGTGKVIGAQTQFSYNYKEYTLIGAYTYLQSTRKDPGIDEYPSEFDQTHNLNLIGVLEKTRWSYSLRVRYITGNPYTPVTGGVYDSDRDVYNPIRGEFFSERFDSFTQVDFRIDRKFVYKLWILSAYLDIQNLLNAENTQGISYNYDFTEKQITRGLPVIPIIGLRGEF